MNNIKIDIIRARVLLDKKKRSQNYNEEPNSVRLFSHYGDKILDLIDAADSKKDLAPFLFDDNENLRKAAKHLLDGLRLVEE